MTELVLVECSWDERADTATWLLATADDNGLDRKAVRTCNAGFLIPQELVDAIRQPVEPSPFYKGEVQTPGNGSIPSVEPEPEKEFNFNREAVRAWAKNNGYEVAEKGRLPKAVIEAYSASLVGSPSDKTED